MPFKPILRLMQLNSGFDKANDCFVFVFLTGWKLSASQLFNYIPETLKHGNPLSFSEV